MKCFFFFVFFSHFGGQLLIQLPVLAVDTPSMFPQKYLYDPRGLLYAAILLSPAKSSPELKARLGEPIMPLPPELAKLDFGRARNLTPGFGVHDMLFFTVNLNNIALVTQPQHLPIFAARVKLFMSLITFVC